jgi:hypothetical protein
MDVLAARGFPQRGLSTPYFSNLVLDGSLMAWAGGDSVAAGTLAVHAQRLAFGEGHDQHRSGVIGNAKVMIARLRLIRGEPSAARDEISGGLEGLATGYGPNDPRTREARVLLDSIGS